MTHADSSLELLGRSRDTGVSGAACPPDTRKLPLSRVTLRVWGLTPADAVEAENAARGSIGSGLWNITAVIASHGGVCPISPGDPLVFGQGADYGQAWAAYPARRPA